MTAIRLYEKFRVRPKNSEVRISGEGEGVEGIFRGGAVFGRGRCSGAFGARGFRALSPDPLTCSNSRALPYFPAWALLAVGLAEDHLGRKRGSQAGFCGGTTSVLRDIYALALARLAGLGDHPDRRVFSFWLAMLAIAGSEDG